MNKRKSLDTRLTEAAAKYKAATKSLDFRVSQRCLSFLFAKELERAAKQLRRHRVRSLFVHRHKNSRLRQHATSAPTDASLQRLLTRRWGHDPMLMCYLDSVLRAVHDPSKLRV